MKSQSMEKNTILKTPPAKKYLVVDDDDNFRYLLLNLFEGEAEVMEGGNGEEALALMETNCFDVVLCDANMPIMGGIEFCKKAMRIDKEFAKYAIILTGDRGGEVRSFCHQNSILLLYKPLSISALKASVKILLMKEEANQLFESGRGRSLVAKTLSHYPESHKTPAQDRRQMERIKVSIPALILEAAHPIREISTGTIMDYSSRGIRFSIPKQASIGINTVSKINEFSVILAMPGASQPLIVKCRPNTISDSEREVQVGAVSMVTDVLNHINWQQYLH